MLHLIRPSGRPCFSKSQTEMRFHPDFFTVFYISLPHSLHCRRLWVVCMCPIGYLLAMHEFWTFCSSQMLSNKPQRRNRRFSGRSVVCLLWWISSFMIVVGAYSISFSKSLSYIYYIVLHFGVWGSGVIRGRCSSLCYYVDSPIPVNTVTLFRGHRNTHNNQNTLHINSNWYTSLEINIYIQFYS